MKKIVVTFVIVCFMFTTATSSLAGGHGHHPRPHPGPVHHPPVNTKIVHKYNVSYDYDWGMAAVALGVGAVAGALVGSYYGPPPRRVCAAPATVVVNPAPTVIVQQPAAVVIPSYAAASSVAITASELNVRSGPGAEHPVIGKVYHGSVLYVKASSPGWLYVALPSGGFGWVMAQYTTTTCYGGMG